MSIVFASSLKQRPIWHELSGCLAKSQLGYEEVASYDFDLAVSDTKDEREKHMFLILEAKELQMQYLRLDQWLSLTKAKGSRTLLLLANQSTTERMQSLQELQLRTLGVSPPVAVLPVVGPSQAVQVLSSYVDGLTALTTSASIEPERLTVLSYATTTAPRRLLNHQEVEIICQICGSLEGLEKATRTQEGRHQLEQYLGANTARALFEFWEDEWLA